MQPTLIRKLFPWILPPIYRPRNANRTPLYFEKIIVIAVVNASSTSFFRFGQGEFTEWPMV